MKPNDTVQVYSVTNPIQAEMVTEMLEAEGIKAMHTGDFQAGFTGIIEVAILVKAEDADRASKILARHDEHGKHKPHSPEAKRD